MDKPFFTTALTALLLSGCISLTSTQKQQIEQLRQSGVDVDNPPQIPGTKPINPLPTALRSLLMGRGDFELANSSTEYPWFLAVGVGNFISWPFSMLWAPFQTYQDAVTINQLRTLEYYQKNSGIVYADHPGAPYRQETGSPYLRNAPSPYLVEFDAPRPADGSYAGNPYAPINRAPVRQAPYRGSGVGANNPTPYSAVGEVADFNASQPRVACAKNKPAESVRVRQINAEVKPQAGSQRQNGRYRKFFKQ